MGRGLGEKERKSLYFEPVYYPLREAKVEDIEKYKWPSAPSADQIAQWKETAKRIREETDYAVVGDVIGLGIFETAWSLQGLDRFMINIHRRLPLVEALLDKVLEVKLKQYEVRP